MGVVRIGSSTRTFLAVVELGESIFLFRVEENSSMTLSDETVFTADETGTVNPTEETGIHGKTGTTGTTGLLAFLFMAGHIFFFVFFIFFSFSGFHIFITTRQD